MKKLTFLSEPCQQITFTGSLIIVCLFFNLHFAVAQNISNLHIEKVQDDGLTNEVITCMAQDNNGFMWFGTEEGVFKYDGYSFKAYRHLPGDTATLLNNVIVSLYAEGNDMWVGTVGGLSCININTNTVKNFIPAKPMQVNTILPADKNGFWLATQSGLYQFNKNTSAFNLMPVMGHNTRVHYMTDDHLGHLYLSSFNGVYCYTKATGACKFFHFDVAVFPKVDKNSPDNRVAVGKSIIDRKGNLWTCSFGAGLIRFDIHNGEVKSWSHPTYDVHQLPYLITGELITDDFDNIWIANTEGGLNIFNPSKNEFTNYPVEWKSENKISDGVISLFRDRSGIVWIGTENGVFKYDPHHLYLERTDIQCKTAAGILPGFFSPLTMMKDNEGMVWLGTYTGVWIYDKKTGVAVDAKEKVGFSIQPFYAVFNIVEDKNQDVWLSAKNLLVKAAVKPGQKPEIYRSDEIQSKIRALYVDDQKRIWLGTHSDGIFKFDPLTKKISACPGGIDGAEKPAEVRAFCQL